MKPFDYPHRRYNPLQDEWVLVSPQRAMRPWKGAVEKPQVRDIPAYDKKCYLCPGNKRISGIVNPTYPDTFVFPNDFQAIEPTTPVFEESRHNNLFHMHSVKGECRVVCFSPKHNLTLGEMSPEAIARVVMTWQEQTSELGKLYQWVQIFENKGDIMGCSNPHPHSQIWASDRIPSEIERESQTQRVYFEKNGKPLLMDYLQAELKEKKRIVLENEDWVVLVPYWALWPFETILLPKAHISRFDLIPPEQVKTLSDITKRLLVKYDSLFHTIFPYTMGWHFAPFDGQANEHWQLHAHYYPPLLRSATIKKFVVGYEMLGEAQRDITPEWATLRLREL